MVPLKTNRILWWCMSSIGCKLCLSLGFYRGKLDRISPTLVTLILMVIRCKVCFSKEVLPNLSMNDWSKLDFKNVFLPPISTRWCKYFPNASSWHRGKSENIILLSQLIKFNQFNYILALEILTSINRPPGSSGNSFQLGSFSVKW